jgi:methylenetetrahydrofolate dehydrogenase (NADP+)/methenyltetrahydrofolate cyclohydrolase
VQEQPVPVDEVGQELVQRIRAARRVDGSVRSGSCNQVLERRSASVVVRARRCLGGSDEVDAESFGQTPDADPERADGAERESLMQRAGAFDPAKLPVCPPISSPAMGATLIDGKALAARIRAEVARDVAAFGRPIGLATVLVGDDPASDVYIRMKQKATVEVGIAGRDLRLPASTSEQELLALVSELNADDAVDGILVQLPLPEQIDEGRIIRAVDPVKDVDGFHPINAGLLLAGTPGHVPGTPLGVLELLDAYEVELKGANAVVIGRSDIVGKPAALLLLHRHATVTVCHSRTRDLAAETLRADVLVAAVGVPGIVRPEMVKEGAAVIDVGINRTEEGLVGDVAPEVADRAGLLTPVPGGVGPMTIAMLLRSTVRAAGYRTGVLAHPAA